MHQGRNNGRNRSRSDIPRNPRPADSGGQGGGQSQWQRKYEHYCTLAQATNAGDGVTREQHWQNAEHFLRLINGSAT